MTTIYVVTSGSYSDYGIRAMFSTREAAQQYINFVSGTRTNSRWMSLDDPGIEEWGLDDFLNPRWQVKYNTQIELKTGDIKQWNYEDLTGTDQPEIESEKRITPENKKYPPTIHVISSRSQAHADKLAVEARQAWLREIQESELIGK